jgi:phosphate/sulfate permease
MVISLAVQSPTSIVWEASVPSAFLLGLFGCRLAMTLYASEISQVKMTTCEILSSTVSVWSFDTILNREAKTGIDPVNFSEGSHQSQDEGGFGGQYSLKKVYEINIVNFAYRILLIQAACLVCLAHGSNDVANSIAPLLVEFRIADTK